MSEVINFVSAGAMCKDTGKYLINVKFGDICMDVSRKLYQVYNTSGGIIRLCQGWKKSMDDSEQSGFQSRFHLFCVKRDNFSPRFLNDIEKWGNADYYFGIYYKIIGGYKYRLRTDEEIRMNNSKMLCERIKQKLEPDLRYEIIEEIQTFNRRLSEIKATYEAKLVPVHMDAFDFNTWFDTIKDSINDDSE